MSQPYPQQQPFPQPAAPKPPRKARRWPWLLGIVAALILGIIIGSAGSGSSTPTAASVSSPAPTTVTATATVTAPAPAPAPAAPAKNTSPSPDAPARPATSFGDGTYKVGTDVAPGSYKTTGARDASDTSMCFWTRSRDDSGSITSIIAENDSMGPMRLTTKSGEYLSIQGCDWTKS